MMKVEIEREAPTPVHYDLGAKFNDDLVNLITRTVDIMAAGRLGKGEIAGILMSCLLNACAGIEEASDWPGMVEAMVGAMRKAHAEKAKP